MRGKCEHKHTHPGRCDDCGALWCWVCCDHHHDKVPTMLDYGRCVGRLRSELTAARTASARWKLWAKGMFRGWRRVRPPADEELRIKEMHLDERGFTVSLKPTRVLEMIADALLDILDAGNAPNCVEAILTDSKAQRVIVDIRRIEGKTMAQLRNEEQARGRALATAVDAFLRAQNALEEARPNFTPAQLAAVHEATAGLHEELYQWEAK